MRLNYLNLDLFNKKKYKDVFTMEHKFGEINIFGNNCTLLIKHRNKYLIPSLDVEFPLKIDKEVIREAGFNVYHVAQLIKPIKAKQERVYTFRQMVDELTSFKHICPEQFKLYGIIALASLIQPIYIRISTESNFGKTQQFRILRALTNNVSIITPKTLARIEYELGNQTIVLNELRNLKSEQIREVEQFLANVCDRSPEYSKGTRGSQLHGTLDVYKTMGKSFIILYNLYGDDTDDKFFDKMFHKNVLDKVMPLKLEGALDLIQFNNLEVIEETAIEEFYVGIIRSIEYYKHNWKKELKEFEMPLIMLKGRHNITFNILAKFVNLYSESQKEFTEIIGQVLTAYNRYYAMLNPNQSLSQGSFGHTSFCPKTEEVEATAEAGTGATSSFNLTEDDLIAFVKEKGEYDEMEFIEKYGEDKLNKLLEKGDVYLLPNSKIKALE